MTVTKLSTFILKEMDESKSKINKTSSIIEEILLVKRPTAILLVICNWNTGQAQINRKRWFPSKQNYWSSLVLQIRQN